MAASSSLSRIWSLVVKEFSLENRDKHIWGGIVLYVFSTLFIISLTIMEIAEALWIAMFWIVVLFSSLNSVLRSFSKESASRQYYYYSIVHPIDVYLSKAIFNFLILVVLGILCFVGLSIIGSNPIQLWTPFILSYLLGVAGISMSFSMLGFMSNLGSSNTTLMAVIGFPLIIPVLIQVVRIGLISCSLLSADSLQNEFFILMAIDLLIIAMGIWLFPYLWRR